MDGAFRRPGAARLSHAPAVFEDRPRAKVNLSLRVTGTRPDGYHELRSIFLRIGLSDRLRVAAGGADGADNLSTSGLDGLDELHGLPASRNLVMRAVEAVRGRAQAPFSALDVTLEKSIPVAAGLGGGSSDCASAIRLAQAAWGIRLSDADELELGASLGADVPFFLSGAEMAVVEGVGERVTPIRPMGPCGLLTVTPITRLATARVFERYDEVGGNSPADLAPDLLGFANLWSAASALRDSNDLWRAATSLAPELDALRDELESRTARPWLMSGSGPTLFAIYPSAAEAAESGQMIVRDRSAVIENATMNAADLVGPDPEWRYA